MYELTIQAEFCAAHALVIRGEREPTHGHNFHVTLGIEASHLDADGLAVDFHAVELALSTVLKPWVNQDLNKVAPFTKLNPSAENIARSIAEQTRSRLVNDGHLDDQSVRVAWCAVTEAPGCAARYTFPTSPKVPRSAAESPRKPSQSNPRKRR